MLTSLHVVFCAVNVSSDHRAGSALAGACGPQPSAGGPAGRVWRGESGGRAGGHRREGFAASLTASPAGPLLSLSARPYSEIRSCRWVSSEERPRGTPGPFHRRPPGAPPQTPSGRFSLWPTLRLGWGLRFLLPLKPSLLPPRRVWTVLLRPATAVENGQDRLSLGDTRQVP